MTTEAIAPSTLKFLEDRWDPAVAATLDEPELLRYRSNLLGSDLRITNFAGGNTSSKIMEVDPLTGEPVEVLWVKGSGGDLGSIKRSGFATLYQEKLLALEKSYKGVELEDEIVGLYPLAAFRSNPVAASIDTPLHGFLPFKHVDHLHPDWGIALAASANGLDKMAEFNREFDHKLVWLPWQRPGFELAMMLKHAVAENPGCDGIVLGGHGLFTWGETQRESYLSTITIIDQLGQFIERHSSKVGTQIFGGQAQAVREDRKTLATQILPFLRGQVGAFKRSIASYSDSEDVLGFVNSANAQELAFLGTSCPDHFIRTKIRPMFVPWDPGQQAETGDIASLKTQIAASMAIYRKDYETYYKTHALPDSPALRDTSPAVVLVVGGGSGIGREVGRLAAERGAHVVVADRDFPGAERVTRELHKIIPAEWTATVPVDITSRDTIRTALDAAVNAFGGVDILVNTAAIFPSSPDGIVSDAMWATTLNINVTANYLLTDEAAKVFAAQNLDVSVVLTSSANAVVSKRGSEAYDVSKAALSHLVRELAIGLSPKIRVNGISPATVVKGSTMFPRDRVKASLTKYNIPFEESLSDDELRNLLAHFYAKRTLTHTPIDPVDCAEAILFLASDRSRCTSGHLIPVDGGLPEAFLR